MSQHGFQKVYVFDVDETLEVSGGPVTFASLIELRTKGYLILLAGNWAVVVQNTIGWEQLFSGMNVGVSKEIFLTEIKRYVPSLEYIMVGNIQGVTGKSDDAGAAKAASWRFISEHDFMQGVR